MARFKYLGEPQRPALVASYGPINQVVVPKKDGTKTVVTAPAGGFPIGQPVDFTDEFSLLVMRADPRFQEV
jgi:hypothetical protein